MPNVGILLIHGTFGSRREFTTFESALKSHGYVTRAISLPGHGDHPDCQLKSVTGQLMLTHCHQEYDRLAEQCDKVFILGHSLGGIISLLIAATNPKKLRGVIALSAPYERAYFVNYFYGFLMFPVQHILPGLRYAPEYLTRYKSPVFLPWWFPTLYKEATWLLKQLQNTLPHIDVPVQLAHSPRDMVIPYGEMQKIANKINKPKRVSMHIFQDCGHQIFPNSREEEACVKLILEFMTRNGRLSVDNAFSTPASV